MNYIGQFKAPFGDATCEDCGREFEEPVYENEDAVPLDTADEI